MVTYIHKIGFKDRIDRVEYLDCTVLKRLNNLHSKIKLSINGKIITVKNKHLTGSYRELNPINYNINMPVPYNN